MDKNYKLLSDSIVLLQEDKLKLEDEKNSVIIYTENGIVEEEIEGKYIEQTKYKISKDIMNKYIHKYKVVIETGVDLRSTPELIENSENKIMKIYFGEYVLGSVLEKEDENNNFWIDVIYINEQGINQGFIEKDMLKKID